ncbi:hypothetical protein BD626DRAFT_368214, partial [Schizophyllum amplum]
LDVDNPCWDDLRFDLGDEEQAQPWMVDCKVRLAIRALLVIDRCREEAARLKHEEANLLNWFGEEWAAVQQAYRDALKIPDAPALRHQLGVRKASLLRLAVLWMKHL